jgi:hypothetical protein
VRGRARLGPARAPARGRAAPAERRAPQRTWRKLATNLWRAPPSHRLLKAREQPTERERRGFCALFQGESLIAEAWALKEALERREPNFSTGRGGDFQPARSTGCMSSGGSLRQADSLIALHSRTTIDQCDSSVPAPSRGRGGVAAGTGPERQRPASPNMTPASRHIPCTNARNPEARTERSSRSRGGVRP